LQSTHDGWAELGLGAPRWPHRTELRFPVPMPFTWRLGRAGARRSQM